MTLDIDMLDALRQQQKPILPEDNMAEAGRKTLLRDFIAMLEREPGSRTGEDIEDLHQMRVATRRMRSTFRLLEPYYRNKPTRPFARQLKQLARQLGKVRDLDVMIADFEGDHDALSQHLEAKRRKARKKLIRYLDSKAFQKFLREFEAFLTKPGKAAIKVDDLTQPHQVRHVLPVLIHDYLASVRAYDTVLHDADVITLHALRIEFKRLRYTIQNFTDILGASALDFIENVKEVQDYLGRLNDVYVARNRLENLLDDLSEDDADYEGLTQQLSELNTEQDELSAGFADVWAKFNTRKVQSRLSDSLLVLR